MVSEHEIRTRSYLLWEGAGRPQGRDMEFWFRAKAQLEVELRAPGSCQRPRLYVVPSVSVSSPPRKTVASRVPMREQTGASIAATR